MKAIKLITTLFSLLFLLLLSSCMPDSMSKWEATPPTKDTAPVVSVLPPANYSYSDGLSGQTKLVIDKNATMTPLAPNEAFTGENVTFSVTPALPAGLSLSSTTGILSGTPTAVSWEKEYTFAATNSGGSVETVFSIEVRAPEILTSLTYVDQEDGEDVTKEINYKQVDKWMRFNPVISSPANIWDINVKLNGNTELTATDAAYPIDCIGKIAVVEGICFDTTTGALMGVPQNAITVPFELIVTAKKTTPASEISKAFKLSFLTAPSGLSYSQSSLMELAVSSTAGISAGHYIKLTDKKGTATTADDTCTFAKAEGVLNSTTLLIKKHDSTATLINRYIISARAAALTTPASTACNATSNVDMTAPTAVSYAIYQVSNVFDINKEFSLTATLLAGEEVSYSISPAMAADKLTNPTFDLQTGEIKAALKDNFATTTYTVTATNKVGSVETTIIIAPVKLPAEQISYSSQVLVMVRDVSAFNIGDWVTAPISDNNTTGGQGKIVNKYYDYTTQTSALVIDIDRGKFVEGDSLDNNLPYHAEETYIGGYIVLEVSNPANFKVGQFISNEEVGFGVIRAISSSSLYVSVFNGIFNTADEIKNKALDGSEIYSSDTDALTTVLDVTSDKVIQGYTSAVSNFSFADYAAAKTALDLIAINTVFSGSVIVLPERGVVAKLELTTPSDVSNFLIGDTVTQTDGTDTVKGTVYAIDETGFLYIGQINLDEDYRDSATATPFNFSAGNVINGTSPYAVTAVSFGHRYFTRMISNTALSYSATIPVIESRHYQSSIYQPSPITVKTGSTLVTLDAAGTATGSSLGRVVHTDSVVSKKVHIAMDSGILYPDQQFDTKNPILQGRGAYPKFGSTPATDNYSNVATTQNIILRRGVPITLFRDIKRAVAATYTISPLLPQGLSLNSTTGEISGTPNVASQLKSYTVTATVNLGTTSVPTSTTFNLKVEEFFEIQLDNPQASYILHRIGKNAGPRPCRVYKDQLTASESEEIDVVCYLEAGELDLYMLGVNFKAVSGPGMCNHMSITPFSYFAKPNYGASTTAKNKFFAVKRDCGAATPVTDEDVVEFPPELADKSSLCPNNHSEKFKCDSGTIHVTTYTYAMVGDPAVCTLSTSTEEVDCGGQISNCIDGINKSFITPAQLDAGMTTKIQAANINAVSEFPYKTIVPIDETRFTNRTLANYSINHQFFEMTNREKNYSFDIKAYNKFFNDDSLGFGDPMSDRHPSYTFQCMDAAFNPKAKIHIFVRDWDTRFNIRSPIDSNNLPISLGAVQSVAGASDQILTMLSSPTSLQLQEGSVISITDPTASPNTGTQFYEVDNVSGTDITLKTAPLRDHTGGIVSYTPMTKFDDMGRVIETMDAGRLTDPVFGEYYNRRSDFDIGTQPDNTTVTSAHLTKRDFITDSIIADQILATDQIRFVSFKTGVPVVIESLPGPVAEGPFDIDSVSGNTVTLDVGATRGRTYLPKLHYAQVVRGGTPIYIFYRVKYLARAGGLAVTLYPITRPFYDDVLED